MDSSKKVFSPGNSPSSNSKLLLSCVSDTSSASFPVFWLIFTGYQLQTDFFHTKEVSQLSFVHNNGWLSTWSQRVFRWYNSGTTCSTTFRLETRPNHGNACRQTNLHNFYACAITVVQQQYNIWYNMLQHVLQHALQHVLQPTSWICLFLQENHLEFLEGK